MSPPTIADVRAHRLDVPLLDPFVIATGRLDRVTNVAVEVVLSTGARGWGEVPILRPVTCEDQPQAMATVIAAAQRLRGRHLEHWRHLLTDASLGLAETPAVRCGVEMALLDAYGRHHARPLYTVFGDHGATVTTDITIPICPASDAERLARAYRAQGFLTIKTKIGRAVAADLDRLRAIRRGHPECVFVLDANEGYSADVALDVLAVLAREGMTPGLLEQPVPRADWAGLGRVAREGGVPGAADESCRSVDDAARIIDEGLAQVINIKLAKVGVLGGLTIAAMAKKAGVGLMVGAMVETRLACGFGAHFAAGVGGFDWVDLDTAFLLAEDPVIGGYRAEGATLHLGHVTAGHGAMLNP